MAGCRGSGRRSSEVGVGAGAGAGIGVRVEVVAGQ